jgi:Sulfotransferase domain
VHCHYLALQVKAAVPADRLLVYSVTEGWEPLCKFLGVPVPDTPFPRKNDRAEMQRLLRTLYVAHRLVPAVAVAMLAAVTAAAVKRFTR